MSNVNELTIKLAGEAGVGIQSTETILISAIKQASYNVFATKEYMSRIRGGTNSTTIRISSYRVNSHLSSPDIFIPFDIAAYNRYKSILSERTIIIADTKIIQNPNAYHLDFNDIAISIGNNIYASMVIAGTVIGIIGAKLEILKSYISNQFSSKGINIINDNNQAAEIGYQKGIEILKQTKLNININSSNYVKNDILLSGAEAIALGALAGGCDSAFAYPMTPGTSVFTSLANWAKEAEVVVEQTEDEISAINMAIGAWYAGARAIVSTSGGGFALMTEGFSLSGMTETPVVVHIAQRPGPATGLPTRTEQGDLNLALYAGHGVFGRAIFAPGTLEQGYELTRHAFDIADKYQSPVILLSDQYFTDTSYNTPEFKIHSSPKKHIVEAKKSYKRYKFCNDILSPRSVPGFGVGRVCVDSGEHDESGRKTEDLHGISLKMKHKRFGKLKLLKDAALSPDLYGSEIFETLFVCWGSTLPIALEAIKNIKGNTALLHFKQVYPISNIALEYLQKAKKIVMIEHNQTAQFRNLIEYEFGIKISNLILNYNGLQFTVTELQDKMKDMMYNG